MPPAAHRVAPLARHEIKYVVRESTARRFLSLIQPHVTRDPFGAGRPDHAYTVRSVYFDGPGLDCYWSKIGGQLFREKYRLRTYNEPGSAPLGFELKQKRGMDYRKARIPLDERALTATDGGALADWLPARTAPSLREMARQRIVFKLRRAAYRPTVLVAYDREAFVGRWDETMRVTVDRHIRAWPHPLLTALHDDHRWRYPIGEWVIVEVKFTRLVPRWLGAVQGRLQLKMQACSKYCTAVAETITRDSGGRWVAHA